MNAIRAILTQACVDVERVAARSYEHANGFYKIMLTERHRLHRWFGYGKPHDHRWDWMSYVVSGHGVEISYDVSFDPIADGSPLRLHRYENTLMQSGTFESRCDVWLRETGRNVLGPGMWYGRPHDQVHDVRPTYGHWPADGPLVTFVVQGRPRRAWADVFTERHVAPTEAIAPLDPNLVKDILLSTLGLLNT